MDKKVNRSRLFNIAMPTLVPLLHLLIILTILTSTIEANDLATNEATIASFTPIQLPIVHKSFREAERELYGYTPVITPSAISFDHNNKPFLRTNFEVSTILNGKWAINNLENMIKPEWKTTYFDTKSNRVHNSSDRIFTDIDNNTYTVISKVSFTGLKTNILLFKKAADISWQSFAIPNSDKYNFVKLEANDSNNGLSPPTILLSNSLRGGLGVQALEMRGSTPLFKPQINISATALFTRAQFGSNMAISTPDTIFVTWAEGEEDGKEGTPTFIAKIDRATNKITRTNYLGLAGNKFDKHNLPAITMDQASVLHIVLGSHNSPFKYLEGKFPENILDFNTSTISHSESATDCVSNCNYYTYPTLLIDTQDTLHLFTRWGGNRPNERYKFKLGYLNKLKNENWSSTRTITVPFRSFYSNWYQKISIDRNGTLFLFYAYYADQLTKEEAIAYNDRWPEHNIRVNGNRPVEPGSKYRYYKNLHSNNPVLLYSTNRGVNWHFATSEFLLSNVQNK